MFDAHWDDPEFWYRFLVKEAGISGEQILSGPRGGSEDHAWWSVFGKKRGKSKKAGPPAHHLTV
ncbi:hypothetical protein GCM10027405_11090 [Arthrobacter alkaliphilus]